MRVKFLLLAALVAEPADAQLVCSNAHPCILTVYKQQFMPSVTRLGVFNGEVFVMDNVGALDSFALADSRQRQTRGALAFDFVIEGSTLYASSSANQVVARSLATSGWRVVADVPSAIVPAIAVFSGAVAYSIRLPDGRREVRLVPQGAPESKVAPTADTVTQLALDQSNVYWIDGYVLHRVGRNGGIATAIGGRLANRVTSLRADRGAVYASTDHDIERMAAGSNAWTVFANVGADELVIDGTDVYWASEARSVIEKASMFGGVTTTVAFAIHPRGFAVDTSSVIFRDASTLEIKQITPK